MNRLVEYDINEVMEVCVLLEEYIEQIVGATRIGELQWDRDTPNLLELESQKSDLLKKIGIYNGLMEEQKARWPERVLERIYFAEIVSNQTLVVCEYCYDYKNPWDSHTWVDVYWVKENVVCRLIDHEKCYEPEDYEFCARIAEELPCAIRGVYTGEGLERVTVAFEGEELPFN